MVSRKTPLKLVLLLLTVVCRISNLPFYNPCDSRPHINEDPNRALVGFGWFWRALAGFGGLWRVLSGFIGLYRVLSGFIRFYRVLVVGFIGFYALVFFSRVPHRGLGQAGRNRRRTKTHAHETTHIREQYFE